MRREKWMFGSLFLLMTLSACKDKGATWTGTTLAGAGEHSSALCTKASGCSIALASGATLELPPTAFPVTTADGQQLDELAVTMVAGTASSRQFTHSLRSLDYALLPSGIELAASATIRFPVELASSEGDPELFCHHTKRGDSGSFDEFDNHAYETMSDGRTFASCAVEHFSVAGANVASCHTCDGAQESSYDPATQACCQDARGNGAVYFKASAICCNQVVQQNAS